MFSAEEKQHIASEREMLLLSLNHPEMPKDKPMFSLHVDGKEVWSWADIKPNWLLSFDRMPRDCRIARDKREKLKTKHNNKREK